MSRLKHSRRGFRRYMQISTKQLFYFVEGRTCDGFFYGELCRLICIPLNVSYEQVVADQLRGDGGGKQVLIRFFPYLRRIRAFRNEFQEKITLSLFFLDKDIDDIERKLLHSEHVAYTEYYHVENYLYKHGSLATALASAASIDRLLVEQWLGNQEAWCASRAELWRDWVKLCLLAKVLQVYGVPGYSAKTSKVNKPPTGVSKRKVVRSHLKLMRGASGLGIERFDAEFAGTANLVDDLYARGHQDLVFKGFWYGGLIECDLRQWARKRPYDQTHLARRLVSSLAATLDFQGQWALPLKELIRRLLETLPAMPVTGGHGVCPPE